jgi:hypothetical protein
VTATPIYNAMVVDHWRTRRCLSRIEMDDLSFETCQLLRGHDDLHEFRSDLWASGFAWTDEEAG